MSLSPAPPRRLLQLVVKSAWVAENLHSLGPGRMYHLAYRPSDMDPDVVQDIASGNLGPGHPGVVLLAQPRAVPLRVADIELDAINDFVSYCRFDFRIVRLYPYQTDPGKVGFLCRYGEEGVETTR